MALDLAPFGRWTMNSAQYRSEVFAEQVPLVYLFARHLLHYRALKAALAGKQCRSSFWIDTSNAHISQACIYWCMVFGSYVTNKTHWHKLAVGPANTLRMSFRKGICEHLGISEAEWKRYWKEMVTFRNQYVAHRDLTNQGPVPLFDRALEVAFFYDSWVRELIAPDILDTRPLRETYANNNRIVALEVASAVRAAEAEPGVPGDPTSAAELLRGDIS
jgi:hypothetical protein